jgi:hypothetical protein
VPIAPADLGAAGHAFWVHLWSSSAWISANSDWEYVAECARLVDDLELARCRYRRTGDSPDGRFAVAVSYAISETLAALRFESEAEQKLGFDNRPGMRMSEEPEGHDLLRTLGGKPMTLDLLDALVVRKSVRREAARPTCRPNGLLRVRNIRGTS